MSVTISRREALTFGVGAVASPLLPTDSIIPMARAPAPLLPAWEVGQEGCMNWRVIFAETAERAQQMFREDIGLCEDCDGLRCAELDPNGECEHAGLDARKVSDKIIPPSETEGEHGLTDAEMNRLGWKHHCDRHHDVCEEWNVVEREGRREIVCDDCMDLADWEIVDPEHAADLRADAEALFWEEFAETLPGFIAATEAP